MGAMSRRAFSAPLTGIGLLLAAACAPAQQHGRAASSAPVLYVGNGLDGTVTRVDVESGRSLGPALPAGVAPHRIVPAGGGSMLVLSAGAVDRRLTHVAPAGFGYAARSARSSRASAVRNWPAMAAGGPR